MKKVLSVLMALLMVVSVFAFSALSVGAASADIYVKDGATGDGTSAGKAFGTYLEAMEAAAKQTGDVTIHVVDEVTVSLGVTLAEPEHTNTITVTGGTILVKDGKSGACWSMGGNIVFSDICFKLTSKMFVDTNFHDITFDEKVTMDCDTSKFYISLRSLCNNGEENKVVTANPTYTLNGGYFWDVDVFQNGTPATLDGTFTVNIGGTATVNNLVSVRTVASKVKNAVYNLNGGSVLRFAGGCDFSIAKIEALGYVPGVTGDLIINVGKDFNIADSFNTFNTTTFFGISGAAIVYCSDTYLNNANYLLNIDEKVYDTVVAAVDKVQLDSFDKVNKVSNPPVTTAPVTTAAPTTTAAPATTAAPTTTQTGESTPATGDASLVLVIAMAAVLCSAAIVVVKKREN